MARPSRECGTCTVCCTVATIPELEKPGFTPCSFAVESASGSCSIFGRAERPQVCSSFGCAWYRGFGSDDARPDRIGALISINNTGHGTVGFLGEIVADAILTTAREEAVGFARGMNMPLIVVAHGTDDAGTWVVLHDSLKEKASAIIGNEVAKLAPDVTMYERVEPD